jgi:hypothetical protein
MHLAQFAQPFWTLLLALAGQTEGKGKARVHSGVKDKNGLSE